MRQEFMKTLVELAEKDEKIILLIGDVEHFMDEFKKKFPERFFNLGLCEQSMISFAAGMALEGYKVVVYSITPFIIERPFEQVKLDIDQQNVPVILVGYSDYPTAGPTHTELNGKELSKLFKNIISYFPANKNEAKNSLIEAYNKKGPSFISLKKDKSV